MSRERRVLITRTYLWAVLALLLLFVLPACDFSQSGLTPYDIKNNWSVGSTVQLARGTEIREGPGTSYCWHTRVPVDRWEVKVTGGPTNGTWYNTSRAALGDPSGGTGWIDIKQADHFPPTQYDGTQCSYSVQHPPPDLLQGGSGLTGLLVTIQIWWRALPLVVQMAVLVIAIAVLIFTFRGFGGPFIGLLQALMLGVILWWIAEQTRMYWEAWWNSFAGTGAPGFPIVVGLVPLVWWAYSLLRYRLPGALRLVLLVALVVVGLYLIAPQRLDEWVSAVQGWFKKS